MAEDFEIRKMYFTLATDMMKRYMFENKTNYISDRARTDIQEYALELAEDCADYYEDSKQCCEEQQAAPATSKFKDCEMPF